MSASAPGTTAPTAAEVKAAADRVKAIPGFATASPIMQAILVRLAELGPLRACGPGRWLGTCPCCATPEGAEFADVWAGAELSRQRLQ